MSLFRDPATERLLAAAFEDSATDAMPHLAVHSYGIRNGGRGARLWVKRWTHKDFFACAHLATALGLLREGLDDAELLAADPGFRALDVLELAWCMYVQIYRRGSREEYQWTAEQNDQEFHHDFRSLPAYLQAFAFPISGFDHKQAADYLLRLVVARLPSMVKRSDPDAGRLGGVELASAAQTADRDAVALRYSGQVSLARALHFLLGGLWSFDDSRLAELLAARILADLRALQLGDAAIDYCLSSLPTCMGYTTAGPIGRGRYGIRRVSPEDSGVLVNARTESLWLALWMDVLARVAASAHAQLVCGFHLGSLATHPGFQRFQEPVEAGRKRVLAAESRRRNQLRARALRPAFRQAQDHLCSTVLAFLG